MDNELGKDVVFEGAIPGRVGNELGGVRLRNALGSGIDPEVPVVNPLMRSEAFGEKVYQGWPQSAAKVVVGLITGWGKKFPDVKGEETLREKGYRLAEEAGFAGGMSKFKEMYPTFQAYKKAMDDLKIPLDLLAKQKAKGFYKEVPANEAEYIARAGEASVGKWVQTDPSIWEFHQGLTSQGMPNKIGDIAKGSYGGRTGYHVFDAEGKRLNSFKTLKEAKEFLQPAEAPMGDWSSIKSAIDSIPRHKLGGLDFITDLRAKFPEMPKGDFDEMVLKLSREGKISLHHHDMPGSYKGEMIKDGETYYHAFGVKPDWR